MRLTPWWVGVLYRALVVPADVVMARQMVRGLRTRAERTTTADPARLAEYGTRR